MAEKRRGVSKMSTRITFEEKEHKYFNGKGEEYISVSHLHHHLIKEKNWEEIAERYASKHGKTVDEVKSEWEEKKKHGCDVGHILHEEEEKRILEKKIHTYRGKEHGVIQCKKNKDGIKESIDLVTLQQNGNQFYPELIIYDEESKVAGQTDLCIVTGKKFFILDYKTDKEIEWESFSTDSILPTYLKEPVSHLQECNGLLYSLKMSMYAYFIKKANPELTLGGIWLMHYRMKRDIDGMVITNKEGSPVRTGRKDYKIRYRENEVKAILKSYKEGKL